uniref:Ig-like domain-containing protein n=1 Tax=Fundulus heteroclitus TaxID=8078 RepID=A0A3Q2PUK4_FUNHE
MLIIIYVLLTVGIGRKCIKSVYFQNFSKEFSFRHIQICLSLFEAVSVGADVILTCPRLKSEITAKLFWIRYIPGKCPEVLGGTRSFDIVNNDEETLITHIRAKQEPATFILHISKVNQSDTGLYYCVKALDLNLTFLEGVFLRIKRKEPNITAIIQHLLPDRVHPGDPVSLQCSVLFNSEDETCSTDHRVYWFQTGSSQSLPSFIYGNHGNECENSTEDHSGRKCIYNFSVNVSASDVGTYYCAVASCGVVIYSKGIKLDIKELNVWDLQKTNTIFILLCAVLTASVVVIFILTYIISKKTCHCSNGNSCFIISTKKKRDGVSLIYTAPTFTGGKAAGTERRNKVTPEAVYSGVRG